MTIAGIPDDFDGDTRAATPDVGADEFAGTALAYNAMLSNLVLSAGAIVPAFDPNTTSYSLSVPNSTTSTTVTPTAQDSTSTITVNTVPVASGTPSGSIALAVGPNTITTVVTAQDGTTTKTYTVTVTRAAPTHTVTYDGNTNTGGTAPVDPNSPYSSNATATVLGPGAWRRLASLLALEHGG